MTYGTIRYATSAGFGGYLAQPVVDAEAQIVAAHGVCLGTIGNAVHMAGHGDHTPHSDDGPSGWIKAIDIGPLPGITPPELFRLFWLPRVSAGLYPTHKYAICDFELRDTRAPFRLRKQVGGDDAGHMHLSYLPTAIRAHDTFVADAVAWHAAGRPNPVGFGRAPVTPHLSPEGKVQKLIQMPNQKAVYITDFITRRWIQDPTELRGVLGQGVDPTIHRWDPLYMARIPLVGPDAPDAHY